MTFFDEKDLGKEIYLLHFIVDMQDVTDDDGFAYVEVFHSLSDLNEYLGSMFYDEDDEVRIFHGFIFSARVLPDIQKPTVSAFIICEDSIIETELPKLPEDISNILNNSRNTIDSIDDLYVMYGYEMETVLTAVEDALTNAMLDEIKGEVGHL